LIEEHAKNDVKNGDVACRCAAPVLKQNDFHRFRWIKFRTKKRQPTKNRMNQIKPIHLVSTLGLAAAFAVLTGCSSEPASPAAATGAKITEAAAKINEGSAKIDTTLAALNDLVSNPQGDLAPKFEKFNVSVDELQSAAINVSNRVAEMRASGNDYFKNWDQQLAEIKNEDIKNRSAERKNQVMKEFTDIKLAYTKASMAYRPFMADLRDVQSALRTDLTAGGVASVKGSADKAKAAGADLKTTVDALGKEFSDLGVAMGSVVPPPSTNAPPADANAPAAK
jgi:hypothetical protein